MSFVINRILEKKLADTIYKMQKAKVKDNRGKMLEKKNAEYWRRK